MGARPAQDLPRDAVFRSAPGTPGATDWTAYYTSIPFTAKITRRYTARALVRALRDAARVCGPERDIVELGGADSCFVNSVCKALLPERYAIIDGNAYGLSLLDGWQPPPPARTHMVIREADVRTPLPGLVSDVAFSVGLVEHFDRTETSHVLRAHFDLVRRGGVVLVSYPAPTWLYRSTRSVLERLGLWKFHDERPLCFAEIASAVGDLGDLLSRRMLWPLLLTQEMVVFRKR